MNKDDLIKKHRIVKIISIVLIVSGFSTYFIFPTFISGFFTIFIFIAPIYMLPPLNMYMLPLFTFFPDFLNLLFALIFIFFFPFIFTFAIYKTIIPLTRKSMLTLMDENALLRNLR
jgi:hypothetical protein